MAVYSLSGDVFLKTRSGLRAWWLRAVRGYRLVEVRKYPKSGLFGGVRYDSIYRLTPP